MLDLGEGLEWHLYVDNLESEPRLPEEVHGHDVHVDVAAQEIPSVKESIGFIAKQAEATT